MRRTINFMLVFVILNSCGVALAGVAVNDWRTSLKPDAMADLARTAAPPR